ncbi:MAG: 3-hydroxyacyl-CoA dehydrogenase, partial [Venatoribacter sp.]
VVKKMVHELNRIGKKAGKGFYDYPEGGKKTLWPELAKHFPVAAQQPSLDRIKQRILYAQAVETLHCVAEGVITRAHEIDLGSIFGWGFAPNTGGVMSFVETIEGLDNFIANADKLADTHGERFRVPQHARDMAAKKASYFA